MDHAGILKSYFPELSASQQEQFEKLGALYSYWNEKINVISRKDIEQLYEHHILHSLTIGKFFVFEPGTYILDAGTGGGFPGIPLAILFPHVRFKLVDSIGKKIRVVDQIIKELDLNNAKAEQNRVESLKEEFDFVVSRAVTRIARFYQWVSPLVSKDGINERSNGIIYLKGGEIDDELTELHRYYEVKRIKYYFKETFFETKKIIYIPVINS